jgi:hypothetical protein
VTVSYEAGAEPAGMVQVRLQPQHTRDNLRMLSLGKFARPAPQAGRNPPQVTPQPDLGSSGPAALTNVIPDTYRLNVEVIGNGGSYVASAKLGEADVLHREFTVTGSTAGELHLTIKGNSATVEGQVTSGGQPAQGAQVYLTPISGGGMGLKFGFCDEQGHYTIAGVAPGDYRIRAWKGSPAVKEILAGTGETLTLQPSERRTVTLEAATGSDVSEQKPL